MNPEPSSSQPPPQEDKIVDDGFSSEEEVQTEQLIFAPVKEEQPERENSQVVKFKLPPAEEIKDKSYSLHPDIETGWNTKKDLPQPIPIIFQSIRYDVLIKRCLRQPKNKARVVYLGPRYENTYYSWYDKDFPFPYSHIKAPDNMKFTNRPFCGQHWQTPSDLEFDSFFEGGNLDAAIKIGDKEYDCFMRVDSNTSGHLQWFNFKVKGWKKLLKYTINICNFQKDKCLFARGMKPYIFSKKKNQREGVGWQQDGLNVKFQKRSINAAKLYEFEMRSYFRLSLEYYSQYQDDQVQIAYCIPYNYTKLQEYLNKLAAKTKTKEYLKLTKLCNSLGGLEVPLMTVHQGLEENFDDEGQGVSKRCVVISGRAHPGQSNGSHMIQGFIEWLCGDSKEAVFLRNHVVFKIVPMLNPDGVALGNYRTGLSGRDFNREYKNPDKTVFPEVYHFKKLVADSKQIFGDRLSMFLDFHGHSQKKNTFMYGPQFPIIQRFYYQARIFPKLLGNITPMFRYYSCIFKINECKISTARAILLRRLGIPLSYTIETSNGSFFDYQLLKDIPYTMEKWVEMGLKIGVALFQYCELVIQTDRHRWEKKQAKKKNKEKDKEPDKDKEKDRRRQPRSPMKPKQTKVVEKASIFSAMENQKIRNLFQEIKEAQQQKQNEKKSDDQLSEGSSDGQGAQDDLSPQQASYLFQMIKGGKCQVLSRGSKRQKSRPSSRKTTEDITQEPTTREFIQDTVFCREDDAESSQVFRGRKAINIRKPINQSKERIMSLDEKKGNTAKIINFSFCSQANSNSRPKDDKLKLYIPPRLNFVEMVTNKWSDDRSGRKESVGRGKVVMDLSDPHFRKTFTYHQRQSQPVRKEPSTHTHHQPPPNIYLPNKRGRFEQYKYRRMINQNEGREKPNDF